jgi:hypothetical protein
MIFGKRLSEYVAFCKYFMLLIFAVGVARLALSIGGVPNSTAKWLSVTVMILIGLVYYAIRVHTTGFGSYKHLLPVTVLLNMAGEIVIVAGIVIAIFTGTDNIFSAPEYSGNQDGKTWLHAGAHLVLGLTVGPLVMWLIGCGIMFITKKVSPGSSASTARA